MSSDRPEVHLRMLTSRDAHWLIEVDEAGGRFAHRIGWDERPLAEELDAGHWATEARWGWAIVVDGEPGGFVLVTDLESSDAGLELRISPKLRGRGVGREVLRQLADHHFAEHENVNRLVARTHENNVPMQRALNAAGFRMEARYRESYLEPSGRYASEWGYALTRADWQAERHQADDHGYDLHGLSFAVDHILVAGRTVDSAMVFKFLQEGRRALARYAGGDVHEGELAGVLLDDVLRYHYVHEEDLDDGTQVVTGRGTARLQRRQDGRLEVVNDWSDDSGRHGKTFLVERGED